VQKIKLSSSEEFDVQSVDTAETGDSSLQSPASEKLMEVLTRAVEKLSIEWPADKQESHSKNKLDERFLPFGAAPQRRCLPFPTSTQRCRGH